MGKIKLLIILCILAVLLHAPVALAEEAGGDDPPVTETAAGMAVLIGSGTFTYLRTRSKKKEEAGYVYFENHTQNGTLKDEEKYPL